MRKVLSALALFACPLILSACGEDSPIARTAEAAPPVVQTEPDVSNIYGRWARSAAFCNAPGDDRTTTIADGRLATGDRTCTMAAPERNGEGWLATLECSGTESEPATERVRFVPAQDALELKFIDRIDNNDERLSRCEG